MGNKRYFILSSDKRMQSILDTMMIAFSLAVFSWFVHARFPLQFFSFASLLLIAFIVSKHTPLLAVTVRQLYLDLFSRKMMIINLLGVEFGLLAAFYFRYSYSFGLFPAAFRWFLPIAILIAITEELLFRGVVQSLLNNVSTKIAAVTAALLHAMYKALIFLPLADMHGTNVPSLFFWSFLAFTFLGYLKQFSGSLAPALLAHIVFDVIVYAEFSHSPWWVW